MHVVVVVAASVGVAIVLLLPLAFMLLEPARI